MSYLELCLAGAILLFSFIGYGKLLLRMCGLRYPSFGLSGSIGVCFTLVVGGVLNFLALVRPPELISFAVVGAGLAGALAWRDRTFLQQNIQNLASAAQRHPLITIQTVLLLGLLAIPVFGSIRANPLGIWGGHDDSTAYFAFPEEMLQLGTLSADPFSERRIQTSLGGGYFLQSFMLVVGDVRTIQFADVALGYILLSAVIIGAARSLRLLPSQTVAAGWLLFLFQFARINATMVILPAALFGALFLVEQIRELDSPSGGLLSWRRTFLLALLVAALCTLKSTYLPAAIIACCAFFTWAFLQKQSAAVLHLTGCLAGVAVLLLPWMLDMKRKEGTLLYPLLGQGYDVSGYNKALLPAGSLTLLLKTSFLWEEMAFFGLPFLVGCLGAVFAGHKRVECRTSGIASLLFSAFLGVVAVDIATGGESLGRYTQPFLVPILLVFMLSIFCWWNQSKSPPRWLIVTAAATALYTVAFVFIFTVHGQAMEVFLRDIHPVPGMVYPLDIKAVSQQGHALQSTVPPRARILTRMVWSFPYDFRRNPIFIADLPGMSSPPPGMPLGEGPDALRSYLLSQKIRYLFFDYRDQGRPPNVGGFNAALAHAPSRHHWPNVQMIAMADVQSNIAELGERYHKLYDDGDAFALDLLCPRTAETCPAPMEGAR